MLTKILEVGKPLLLTKIQSSLDKRRLDKQQVTESNRDLLNGSSWQAYCVRLMRNHTISDGKLRLREAVAYRRMTLPA